MKRLCWGWVLSFDDIVGPPDDPGMIEVLQCGESSPRDVLGGFYHLLESLPFLTRAVPVPHSDGATQDAFDCAPIKVRQKLGWHAKLP